MSANLVLLNVWNVWFQASIMSQEFQHYLALLAIAMPSYLILQANVILAILPQIA